MGYRIVEGSGLRTRYAAAPAIVIHAVTDGPLVLEISFQSESARAGTEAGFTRLWFEDVREYRWIAGDQTYFPANPDDFEFALIEIIDSDQITLLLAKGLYANQPPGQRLGGTIDESELHHYRIGFDEYGSFDVICTGLRVERFRSRS